jgi:hypothetical protein
VTASPPRPSMRFTVDTWDPGYGSSMEIEDDLGVTRVVVTPDVEVPADRWRPIAARGADLPSAVLFVDGVRRLEARLWIEDDAEPDEATSAVCASYAAGVICCCAEGAHLLTAERRRGLFTTAPHAADVRTTMGDYPVTVAPVDPSKPLALTLSAAIQRKLSDLEVVTAVDSRTALANHGVMGDDLLVIDGPIRGREHLPRALGYIKSHQSAYLDKDLHRMVGTLSTGERTPVFRIGGAWNRYSWYLRLPCLPAAPWAGIVRLECGPDVPVGSAVDLANLSQTLLPRYGSAEYKDPRAPQNLYPIAGLERELRHRLGDARVLYRALRRQAAEKNSAAG